jgi:hypothetical protein
VAAQLTQPSGVESVRRSSPLAVRLGSAAILAAALTVCFVALTLLFPAAPWRGIDAYEASSAATEIVALVPVLLLAPVVVVLMACIHHLAAGSRQVAGQLAGIFAAVYATIVTVNYVVQLYVVRLGIGAGEVEGLALLAMPNPRSVFVALEIAGYGFFALMALAAAAAVSGRKLERWIRYAFLVAGAAGLAGTAGGLADQRLVMLSGFGLPLAAFVAGAVLLVIHFQRLGPANSRPSDPRPSDPHLPDGKDPRCPGDIGDTARSDHGCDRSGRSSRISHAS